MKCVPVAMLWRVEIRVVPRAGPEKDDTSGDVFGDPRARQAPAAIVEHLDDIAIDDASIPSVVRMDQDGFAPVQRQKSERSTNAAIDSFVFACARTARKWKLDGSA